MNTLVSRLCGRLSVLASFLVMLSKADHDTGGVFDLDGQEEVAHTAIRILENVEVHSHRALLRSQRERVQLLEKFGFDDVDLQLLYLQSCREPVTSSNNS
jgi:hypothetical protein